MLLKVKFQKQTNQPNQAKTPNKTKTKERNMKTHMKPKQNPNTHQPQNETEGMSKRKEIHPPPTFTITVCASILVLGIPARFRKWQPFFFPNVHIINLLSVPLPLKETLDSRPKPFYLRPWRKALQGRCQSTSPSGVRIRPGPFDTLGMVFTRILLHGAVATGASCVPAVPSNLPCTRGRVLPASHTPTTCLWRTHAWFDLKHKARSL